MPPSAATPPPHHCHAEGCEVPIEPGYLLCRPHFMALPNSLRRALSEHHGPSVWSDEPASPRYALASVHARIWLAEQEGREVPGYLLSRQRILERDLEKLPKPKRPNLALSEEQPGLFDQGEDAVGPPSAPPPEAPPPAAPPREPAPPQPSLFQGAPPPRPPRLEAQGPAPVSVEDAARRPGFAALLAAMRLGPPRWRERAEALGPNDARRVGALARVHQELPDRPPGAQEPRAQELVSILGHVTGDLALNAMSLGMRPRETPGAQVRRAWKEISRSLRAGVPALGVVEIIAAEAPPRGGTPRWVAHPPRIWVFVEVAERLDEDAEAFWLRTLDPLAPGWQTLLCHRVAARPFAAPVGEGAARRWTQGSPLPALSGPWVEGPVAHLAPHRRALVVLSELVIAS